MTVPGLGGSGLPSGLPSGQLRLGFRSGRVRSAALTLGGVGLAGMVYAIVHLAAKDTEGVISLLYRWGSLWLVVLAAMAFLWDLAKLGLGHLGKLVDSVQESAVAITRIADRDDRERDRMATETAYLGQRMEKLSGDIGEVRSGQHELLRGQSENHREILDVLRKCGALDRAERGDKHERS